MRTWGLRERKDLEISRLSNLGGWGEAQWLSVCLAWARLWVWSPVPERITWERERKKKGKEEGKVTQEIWAMGLSVASAGSVTIIQCFVQSALSWSIQRPHQSSGHFLSSPPSWCTSSVASTSGAWWAGYMLLLTNLPPFSLVAANPLKSN